MKIAQHLSDLLFHKDIVILPGFGEFSTVPESSGRTQDGRITPPRKTIAFNQSVKANDYVLARYVAERELLSLTDSNELILSYVEELKKTLQEQQSIVLPSIGSFTSDESGNLSFVPSAEMNFATASFGLSSVNMDEAQSQPKPVADDSQEETPLPPKKKSKLIWLIFLLLVIIAASIWGYFNQDSLSKYVDVIQNKLSSLTSGNKTSPADSTTVVSQDTIQMTDTIPEQPIIEEVLQDSIPENPTPQTEPPISTTQQPTAHGLQNKAVTSGNSPQGKYVIVAGCFGEKANAEKMIQKLKEQGFSEAFLDGQTSSGLHKVSVGIFTTMNDAQTLLKQANAENKLQKAWILKY